MTNCSKCASRGALTLMFVLFFGGIIQGAGAQAQARSFELMEATIPQLQAALATGMITSRDLVTMYLARIEAYDQRGPTLNAIASPTQRRSQRRTR
jgi:hypothetical protein